MALVQIEYHDGSLIEDLFLGILNVDSLWTIVLVVKELLSAK